MPHSAEALKDQADDLTLACHSFSQGRFFFISPNHLDAYLQLLDSLKQQRRLTILIGEPGIGKTTLLTKLISETPPRIKLVLCDPIDADFDRLLALINERLGLSAPGDTRARRLSALHSYLNAPAVRIDSLVLLIEDAQHLSETVFEELFKLILSEQNVQCPLRLILSGSPRLTQCLAQRKILRVLPADTLFLHLSLLDSAATATYIYRQLGNAGSLAPEALVPAVVSARIAHYARGLPQLINRLCEHALEIAQKTGQFSLTVEMVDQAANELGMDSSPAAPTERKPPSIYFAVLVVLASLIAVLIGLPHLLTRLPLISKPGAAASATVSALATDQSAGQHREPPPVASPEATVPQVTTAVPAVPPAAAPAPQVEPPAPDVKPTAALAPSSASPTQAPIPQSVASRPDRISSVKPATNRRAHSPPPARPIVPTVQVRKTPPPLRPKANPSSTQYKSAAYQKRTVRPAPHSEPAVQDSTESNGWRIRK